MSQKLNTGRQTPGLRSIPGVGSTGSRSVSGEGPAIPRKQCPFGLECRRCVLGIAKEGKLECSIKVLAVEAMKAGIEVGGKKYD